MTEPTKARDAAPSLCEVHGVLVFEGRCPDCETNGFGFRRLYRYFRVGGFYRFNPRSRRDAARLAWAYSRKAKA